MFYGKEFGLLQSSVTVLRQRKISLCFHDSYICTFKRLQKAIQGESVILLVGVAEVKLCLCDKETLYPKFNCYGGNKEIFKKVTAVIYLLITKYVIKRGKFAVSVMLTQLCNI
jgi:hypothetical protein